MHANAILNLIVIDDDQLYAERLVSLLSSYYDEVNLGFLDDKEELVKILRQQWDVLVFGKAYDMSFPDVVGIVQQQNIDLPMICLMNDDTAATGRNEEGLPAVIDGTMVMALLPDKELPVVMAICLQHDNLRSRRQLKTLRHVISEAEQRANILIKNSKSAVAYIDQGIHIFANDPYLTLFGFESMEDVIGLPIIDLIAGGDNVKGFKQFLRQFDRGSRSQVEFAFESRRPDNTTFEAKLQLAAATLEGEPVTQIIIQQNSSNSADIAKKLAAAERLDNLTGLTNRLGFEERFEALHQQVLKGEVNAALLYIQLDNIGKIRTGLGLQGVDSTIKQVAYILDNTIKEGYVSRFSDSAFTVLVENLTTQQVEALAADVGECIRNMLIEVDKRTTHTTASIGVVQMDKNAPAPKVLLERALDAINHIRVKTANNGDSYYFYNPSEHANSDDEALAEALVEAITYNRFELLFQPIYDISNDRSDFFEVYLRLPLSDAEKTVLTPNQFMAVAKTHELREKIDRWVLINASKQLNEVRKSYPAARLLVQLTSASLVDDRLPSIVSQLIKAVGGTAGALTLQFNEQDISNYLTRAKAQFAALKKVGCQIGVHNFGTSAKSLEIVEFVHPDLTRLARNYVEDIGNPENLEALKSLIGRTNEFHIDVMMPYIEEAATMSVAWSVGARYLQGYYLEEPSSSINIATA